ncbi:MAG: hypothetical protein ACFB03_19325 [Paracoccaceae bacterium]
MSRFPKIVYGLFLASLLTTPAKAHQDSTAYLDLVLSDDGATARLEVSLEDLDYALGLNANADRKLDWSEVQAVAPRIRRYIEAGLTLVSADADCQIMQGAFSVNDRRHGDPYLVIPLDLTCGGASPKRLTYELLFTHDRRHRVKTKIVVGDEAVTEVLTNRNRVLALPVQARN